MIINQSVLILIIRIYVFLWCPYRIGLAFRSLGAEIHNRLHTECGLFYIPFKSYEIPLLQDGPVGEIIVVILLKEGRVHIFDCH